MVDQPAAGNVSIISVAGNSVEGGSIFVEFSGTVDALTSISFTVAAWGGGQVITVPTQIEILPQPDAPEVRAVFSDAIVVGIPYQTTDTAILFFRNQQGQLVKTATITNAVPSPTDVYYYTVPITGLEGVTISWADGPNSLESNSPTKGGQVIVIRQSLFYAFKGWGQDYADIAINSRKWDSPPLTFRLATTQPEGVVTLEIDDMTPSAWPTSFTLTFTEDGTGVQAATYVYSLPTSSLGHGYGLTGTPISVSLGPADINIRPGVLYNISCFASNPYYTLSAPFAPPQKPYPNVPWVYDEPPYSSGGLGPITPPQLPSYAAELLAGSIVGGLDYNKSGERLYPGTANNSPSESLTYTIVAPANYTPSVTVGDVSYNTAKVSFISNVISGTYPYNIISYDVIVLNRISLKVFFTGSVPWEAYPTVLSLPLTGLPAGINLAVNVYPVTRYGRQSVYGFALFTTLALLLPPTDLAGTATGNTVALTFNAPVPQQDPIITSYTVRRDSRTYFSVPGVDSTGMPIPALTFVDRNLIENNTYDYSVSSNNSKYQSAFTSPVSISVPITMLPVVLYVDNTNTTKWTVGCETANATGLNYSQLITVTNPLTAVSSVFAVTPTPSFPNGRFSLEVDLTGVLTEPGTWNVTTTSTIDFTPVTSVPWVVEYVPPQPDLFPPVNVDAAYILPVTLFPNLGIPSNYATHVITWQAPTPTPNPFIKRYYIYSGDPAVPSAPVAIVNGLDGTGEPIQSFSHNITNVVASPTVAQVFSYYIVADSDVFQSPPSNIASIQVGAGWGNGGNQAAFVTGVAVAGNSWTISGFNSKLAGAPTSFKNTFVITNGKETHKQGDNGVSDGSAFTPVVVDVSSWIKPGTWYVNVVSTSFYMNSPQFVVVVP